MRQLLYFLALFTLLALSYWLVLPIFFDAWRDLKDEEWSEFQNRTDNEWRNS